MIHADNCQWAPQDHHGPCQAKHYQQRPVEDVALPEKPNMVDHPAHYGGRDDHYEAIKVIEAWGLGFCLGNTVKYIARAGKKGSRLEDLKKARWYLDREISRMESDTSS